MADQAAPWETFKNARVVDTPAEQATPAVTADDTAPPKPWEAFKNARVVDAPASDNEMIEIIGNEADKHLAAENKLTFTPMDDTTWLGLAGRAGRSSTFGLSDYLSAAVIRQKVKQEHPDWTYDEIVKALRKGYKDDPSVGGELVGALLPGAIIAKGATKGGRLLTSPAVRAGLTNGAVKWAARHPKLSRVIGASALGGSAAATEEAVRASVDESIGASVGEEFNPQRIIDDTLTGAFVGAVGGPAFSAAGSAVGKLANWAKASFGGADTQTLQASRRILDAVRMPGEPPDDAIKRLNGDVQRYVQQNGRQPALAEIIAPERVEDLADVMRYYSGLGERGRKMSDEMIARAITNFDDAVRSGQRLKDDEVIEAQMENIFSSVMRRAGNVPVNMPEESVDALARNRGLLASLAKNSEEARRVMRVVDARESIGQMRETARRLVNRTNIADAKTEIAQLGERIARLLDSEFNSSSIEPSELAALRNLKRLRDSIARRMQAVSQGENAQFDLEKFMPELRAAENILRDYEANGLKISLSAANDIRRSASREVSRASRTGGTLADINEAIAVRDAMAPVGAAEVPRYGQVVKMWNRAFTRAEAQATGRAAAKGSVSPANLDTRLTYGRLPDKPRADVATVRAGAEEGARLDLSEAARGTKGEAVRAADRVASSPKISENLRLAIPDGAEDIIAAAIQTGKSVKGANALRAKSPGAAREMVNDVKEMAEAVAVTGVSGTGIGGAATAGLIARQFKRIDIPRGTAEKLIDMLGDPDQSIQALRYMADKGVDLRAFFGVLANELNKAAER